MSPGDLVVPRFADVIAWESIVSSDRVPLSYMSPGSLCVVLDSGFSPTDIYYYKVLLPSGVVGWVKAERVKTVSHNASR